MPKTKTAKKTKMTKAISAKRSDLDIQQLMDKFTGFVKKNPGLRIEQINAQLGTTTKELAIPVRRLLATRKLRSDGEKRGTQYFAR